MYKYIEINDLDECKEMGGRLKDRARAGVALSRQLALSIVKFNLIFIRTVFKLPIF